MVADNEQLISSTPIGDVVGKVLPGQSTNQQLRILTLHKGDNEESILYRLEKGWILGFYLGPTLFGLDVAVYTNHPPRADVPFDRNKYYKLDGSPGSDGIKNLNMYKDDTSYFAELPLIRAGSFNYYVAQETGDTKEKLGSGHFIVSPVLSVGPNDDDVLLLDSIQCQTVLPKCLGPFVEWEDRLRVSKEIGYNMIHFSPVQELGGSNSSYCIKDQLSINPNFSTENCKVTFHELQKLTSKMEKEWGVLSICDVVLNHTANESPWLVEHPECTYNMHTAPHLVPAAALDGYLHVLTKDVGEGKLADRGIPCEIYEEKHLKALESYLKTDFIPKLRLHEFHTCDVDKLVSEFVECIESKGPSKEGRCAVEMKLIYDSFLKRHCARVDIELARAIYYSYYNCRGVLNKSESIENFKKQLHQLNSFLIEDMDDRLTVALRNIISHIEHQRIRPVGTKTREVSERHPLVPRYFTGEFSDFESVDKEILERGEYVMAHNGWVMNSAPLKNFAAKDSDVYIRRELIAWGDNIKLRYGERYEDCPFLWDHMRQYVELTAATFHGVRLDNCHSTPLPVAEYLLDCARKIRPDLYVLAELFTNSREVDNIFVNRLGITCLIREAVSAPNCRELGNLVYSSGGVPVGSFHVDSTTAIAPSMAPAMLFDMTHDNGTPFLSKGGVDSLGSLALVAMACCATGSARGYDELVPHSIDVVKEERLYASWTEDEVTGPGYVNSKSGYIAVKGKLNRLHKTLNDEGYTEIFVDQINNDVAAITRHNPTTCESVVVVASTCFTGYGAYVTSPRQANLQVEGVCTEILLEAFVKNGFRYRGKDHFKKDETYINGLTDLRVSIKEHIPITECSFLVPSPPPRFNWTKLSLKNIPLGAIIVMKFCPNYDVKPSVDFLERFTSIADEREFDELASATKKLTLSDLNYILYRCSEEDLEDGVGSAYHVPGHGILIYSGIQGFASLLADIKMTNDLGHPFCRNLREGNWMLDYITVRLKGRKRADELRKWLQEVFDHVRRVPRHLMPKYFDIVITAVSNFLIAQAICKMSKFVRRGSAFVKLLAMGSVQCVGEMKNASFPQFSPIILDPEVKSVTMAAGLPHFTVGIMRSWGRDTFISLRGLFLITGRYDEARHHILAYASCLRHGLVPNLLSSGIKPRYNSRDAVWWWIYSIMSYIDFVPDGHKIFESIVTRLYPDDSATEQPLYLVIQEALTKHFKGLSFREKDAGPSLDLFMTNAGFDIKIGVDYSTGFVYGGNDWNCGTWMDKMGSSKEAGNSGHPATPRDGCAVEIVGLCRSVLRSLVELHKRGLYPYDGVERKTEKGHVVKWTFDEWGKRIDSNFENHFWVSQNPRGEGEDFVHKRGIYKDTVGATRPWADFQLRCNFPIALALAPEMVDPDNAWKALQMAEKHLLGPLGIKTLDPDDWNYNGYYNNEDSSDPHVADGFNYHQGPEWVWPVGFFLRAKLHFAKERGPEELNETVKQIRSYLSEHYKEIVSSHWRGLPELTNENGAYCERGCRVQAWSMACIMEVFYDLEQLNKPQKIG